MEILKYKEFEGSAELDMERKVCRGKILHIDDLVTYEANSIGDLEKQFQEAVDDYIETCREVGKEPQKPCRGQFNVRVSPELHRAATRRALTDDTSLNDVVCKALEAYLAPNSAASTSTRAISYAAQASTVAGFNVADKVQPIVEVGDVIVGGSSVSRVAVYAALNPFYKGVLTPVERYWEPQGSQIVDLSAEGRLRHDH